MKPINNNKLVIVCVDDEQIVLNSLKTELVQAFGAGTHIIEIAESGEEALEVIAFHAKRKNQVAVLISDYIMPEMKGDELLIRVHQEYPTIVKILLTGQVSLEGVSNAINNAALFRYIPKPWEANDLVLTIGAAIQTFLTEQLLVMQNEELRLFNKELEQKVEERTEELRLQKEHVDSSIRYALRIQRAILPSRESIYAEIKDYFIIYKPRDIVSGDFFWFSVRDSKIIMIVSDCTGHGVPGAFMSLIGDSLLNRIITDKHILEPNLILEELNNGLRNAWRDESSQLNDGMETAIVVIDKSINLLEYAGAKSPLFYVYKGEGHYVESTRAAIDGQVGRLYEKHILELKPATRYFMYSDGFQDQSGGEQRRRMQSKVFRKLLLDTSDRSLQQQKEYLNSYLEDWRRGTKQIDDILVWGFEII